MKRVVKKYVYRFEGTVEISAMKEEHADDVVLDRLYEQLGKDIGFDPDSIVLDYSAVAGQ